MSDKRSGKRTPVMLRIKLRYPDVDTFVGKFATNVSRGGMFIASRKPKPVGSKLKFELQLADGSLVIGGEGVVRWVREFDETNPRRPHGMGIEFTKLSDESAAAMDLLAEQRKVRGLDENSIPMEEKKKEEPAPEAEAEAEAEEKPKKRAKRKTKSPEGKKKKKRAKRNTKSQKKKKKKDDDAEQDEAAAATPQPAPEPEPAPEPPPAVPVHIDLADTDRQLAAILETDAAGIAEMILRAREIAFEAGDDGDIDALLHAPAAPAPQSIADASAELSGIVGATPVPARKPTPAAPRRARGTTPPPPPGSPLRQSDPDPEPPPDDEDDTFVGLDPEDLIPIADEDDPITVDEPIGMAADLDDLAYGTPPPPPDTPDADSVEPMLEPRGGGDSTIVESSIPDSAPIEFSAETTPLPPPVPAEDQVHNDFTPPPDPADQHLSQELAVDAMDADDLIASGLDELPSGTVAAVDSADEFSEEAPTNVVAGPDGEIPTDVVDGDDDEINAALESLLGEHRRAVGNNTDDVTAVRDDTGQRTRAASEDGIEIDLGDFDEASGGEDDGDDDPDDPDGSKKKGFFKRIFGKS